MVCYFHVAFFKRKGNRLILPCLGTSLQLKNWEGLGSSALFVPVPLVPREISCMLDITKKRISQKWKLFLLT